MAEEYYLINLDDISIENNSFSFSATVGTGLQLQVAGSWDTVLQYQYDTIKNRLATMSRADPLYSNEDYNRDYDYIAYYMALDGVNISNWLDTNPPIPNSLKTLHKETQIVKIRDRITFCKDLQPILTKYEEGLRWNIVVKDNNGVETSAVIQPGGWFRNQADDYSFVFLSTKEYVGFNDLPYTGLIVRLNNAS